MSAETDEDLVNAHRDALSHALLALQFLEESIRMYLAHCFRIIAGRVAPIFVYGRTYASVRKKSLGQLAHEFREFCGDTQLVSTVKDLVNDRNFCAHEALLLTVEETRDPAYMRGAIARLRDIHKRADACLMQLIALGKFVQGSDGPQAPSSRPTDAA